MVVGVDTLRESGGGKKKNSKTGPGKHGTGSKLGSFPCPWCLCWCGALDENIRTLQANPEANPAKTGHNKIKIKQSRRAFPALPGIRRHIGDHKIR